MVDSSTYSRTTSRQIHVGTTVRYHWRGHAGLATVVETTDRFVSFAGPDCDGRFNRDQIDRLIDEGRLQVVLGEESHAEIPWWGARVDRC